MLRLQNFHLEFTNLGGDTIIRWITGNESFFDSPLKGAVEHEMNAPHRGTAQSLSTGFGFPLSALFHQVLVELLEVTGSQLGQLDVSDALIIKS